jgi:hypothetical protein
LLFDGISSEISTVELRHGNSWMCQIWGFNPQTTTLKISAQLRFLEYNQWYAHFFSYEKSAQLPYAMMVFWVLYQGSARPAPT